MVDAASRYPELSDVIARRHSRMVAVARRLLQDEDDARDAVQDAYVRAVVHLERFDGRSRLSTWLHRIVVNAALMRLRARRRRPAERLDVDTLADAGGDVEATVARRQVQRLVRRSLADLSTSHRAVLVLRHMQDAHPREVTRALGVTPGAVKLRAHRARNGLRQRLVRIGIGASTASIVHRRSA